MRGGWHGGRRRWRFRVNRALAAYKAQFLPSFFFLFSKITTAHPLLPGGPGPAGPVPKENFYGRFFLLKCLGGRPRRSKMLSQAAKLNPSQNQSGYFNLPKEKDFP